MQGKLIDLEFLHPKDSTETFQMGVAPQATARQTVQQLLVGDADGPWLDPEPAGRPYELVLSRTEKLIPSGQTIGDSGAADGDYIAVMQPGQGAGL